jgi:hypothetical protein
MYTLESTLARLTMRTASSRRTSGALPTRSIDMSSPPPHPPPNVVFLSHLPSGLAPDTDTIALLPSMRSAAVPPTAAASARSPRATTTAQRHPAARVSWALARSCPPQARPG